MLIFNMFQVDIYSIQGTIIPNECDTLDEVIYLLRDSIDSCQLINIQKL